MLLQLPILHEPQTFVRAPRAKVRVCRAAAVLRRERPTQLRTARQGCAESHSGVRSARIPATKMKQSKPFQDHARSARGRPPPPLASCEKCSRGNCGYCGKHSAKWGKCSVYSKTWQRQVMARIFSTARCHARARWPCFSSQRCLCRPEIPCLRLHLRPRHFLHRPSLCLCLFPFDGRQVGRPRYGTRR